MRLLLPDGGVAATGAGKYLRLPLSRIADFDTEAQEWRVTPSPADPDEIPLPASPRDSDLWHNGPATDTRLPG